MDLPPEPQGNGLHPGRFTIAHTPIDPRDPPGSSPRTPRHPAGDEGAHTGNRFDLDDACTLLAALRMGLEPPEISLW